jgi:5'-nucleotidase
MTSYAGVPPLILVTCDDGISSPGLRAVVGSALDLGEVLISAPGEQQTSAGRSQPSSFDGAIHEVEYVVDGRQVPAYAVYGSPAQAVLYALMEVVPRQPALCISGINFGENVGSGITVSGTVGAALEAASHGIPSLAVSVETDKAYHYTYSDDVDFRGAAYFTHLFAERMLGRRMPPDVDLLKVEVPSDATPGTPWRMTRVSRQRYYEALPSNRRSLSEKRQLDYELVFDRATLEPDSDIYALQIDRAVSVSPISLDMTSRVALEQVERLLR